MDRTIARGACALAVFGLLTGACADNSTPPGGAAAPAAAAPASNAPAAANAGTPSAPSAQAAEASPAPGAPSAPAEPAAPQVRDVIIPAGTVLNATLTTAIASDTSRPEQRVEAALTRAVSIDGADAIASGATLRGIVTAVERSGRVKGRANIAFRFDRLASGGTTYDIATRTIAREAEATKGKDAAKVGIGAGGGAVIGGIVAGKSGAAKGALIGGAAGTGAVLATRGEEVRLPAGTAVRVTLTSPLTVRVPIR